MRIGRAALVVAVSSFLAPLVTAAEPIFPNPGFGTGPRPMSIVTIDIDGDGILDLVVSNTAPNDLSVLLGRPGGLFAPERRIPTAYQPELVLAGRFNDDGRPDIVVFSTGSLTIQAFLGQPDGSLTPGPPRTGLGAMLYGAVGDFNGDNLDDVVTADLSGFAGFARVYINQGAGAFASATSVTSVFHANGAAAGDFDEDGRTDIVLGANGGIAFHRNLGGGAFGPAVTFTVGVTNAVIAPADLNADGHLDLAIANHTETGQPADFVSILLGDGNGAFTTLGWWSARSPIWRLAFADMDADGDPDMVLAEWANGLTSLGRIEVLPGHGDGTFGAAAWYGAGRAATSVAIGDFDRDGHPDVAAPLIDADFAATFRNLGDGTFEQPRFGSGPTGPGLARADFNGDGREDLATISFAGAGGIAILLGRDDGTFEPERLFYAGPTPVDFTAADFNGDGAADIAVANGNTANVVSVLLGTGDGAFGPPVSYPGGEGHRDIAAADFTHDGVLDLVVTNEYFSISVLPGLGDGRFGIHSRYPAQYQPMQIEVGDLDDDGLPDVVAYGLESTYPYTHVIRLMGAANGTLEPAIHVLGQFGQNGLLQDAIGLLQDVDGDGREDLLLDASPYVALLRGRPEGDFGPAELVASCFLGGVRMAAIDFDGDGIVDLAVGCGGIMAVQRGVGSGQFLPPEPHAVFPPQDLVAGDFNGDGRMDLAYRTFEVTVGVLLNQASPNHAPVAAAGDDTVEECTSPLGAMVVFDGTGSTDPDSSGTSDDIGLYEWFESYGTPGHTRLGTGETLATTLSLGTHVVTLVVTDTAGHVDTDDRVVQVADTTPPAVTATLYTTLLWPPNHRLVPVQANAASSDACGPVTLTLASVTSSEPDDAPQGGDGATTNDIQDVSPGTLDASFLLRAERDAGGSGRTYTVVYSALDGAGNPGSGAAMATVPLTINGTAEPLTIHLAETPQGTRVSWNGVPGALWYEVARGPLDLMRAGLGFPSCLASNLASLDTTGLEDPAIPEPEAAFVYLVESFDPDPSGYGTESSPQDLSLAFQSLLCP